MGYQVYQVGKRFGGYGVPAICEHPDCEKEIDRGMAHACGGEPFSEIGCDRYFCSEHLDYQNFKCDGSDEICDHGEEDCECTLALVCERCAQGKDPFPYKPDTKEWVTFMLEDNSWAEWRSNHPQKVEEMKKSLNI